MTAYEYLVSALSEPLPDGCMEWPRKRDKDGYGLLKVPVSLAGKRLTVRAHRLSFKIKYGHWPTPLGLHSCDNPKCFNPLHIKEGDHARNQSEKVERGRSLVGTRHREAKLTDSIVESMRQKYSTGNYSFSQLAKEYGVTRAGARFAVRGISWGHIGSGVTATFAKKLQEFCHRGHPLTPENVYVYGRSRQCKECTTIRTNKRRKKVA